MGDSLSYLDNLLTNTIHMTLKVTFSIPLWLSKHQSLTYNSFFQNYPHPDDHTIRTTDTVLLPWVLLRAQDRPATLILTVTSGLRLTRAHHVHNRDAETGN